MSLPEPNPFYLSLSLSLSLLGWPSTLSKKDFASTFVTSQKRFLLITKPFLLALFSISKTDDAVFIFRSVST